MTHAFHAALPCGRIISIEQDGITPLHTSKSNVNICHIISSMQHKHKLQGHGQITPLFIPVIEHLDMDGHGYGMVFNLGVLFLTRGLIERKK